MSHKPGRSKGCFTDVKPTNSPLAVGSTAESPDMPPYLQVPGIAEFWQGYNRRKGNARHRVLLHKGVVLSEPIYEGPPVTPIHRCHAPRERTRRPPLRTPRDFF
jgi:hypothetical protein